MTQTTNRYIARITFVAREIVLHEWTCGHVKKHHNNPSHKVRMTNECYLFEDTPVNSYSVASDVCKQLAKENKLVYHECNCCKH